MSVPQTASKSVLHDLISTLETPVLFANLNEGSRRRLTLHTAMSGTGRGLHRKAKRALSEAGIEVRCKVKEHDEKRLLKTASLDRLVREFGRDSIVFDPTGGIGRARAVVRCAARIRGTLGAGLAGIYLEPWRRTLYVVLHRDTVVRDGEVAVDRLREIESSVAGAVHHGLDGVAGSFSLKVRVGFGLPNISLVPVDAASARAGRAHPRVLRKLRTSSYAATVAGFLGAGVAGSAMADGSAVSGPNAKISIGAGDTDGDATGLATGSVSFPVGDKFGAQIDGAFGGVGGDAAGGIGGHLFWRDPDKGLLGLTAAFAGRDSRGPNSGGRAGVEGELYLGQFTTGASAGYQFGEIDHGGVGSINLRWYGTDDFMLSGGGAVAAGDSIARFGAEYQPGVKALPGLSVFADAEFGEHDWDRVFVGLRFYFGGKTKSLIRRHREDDPEDTDRFWKLLYGVFVGATLEDEPILG